MSENKGIQLKTIPPRLKVRSRLFYAEHDVVESESKSLIYSVYSVLQSLNAEMNPMHESGVQRFGVLWEASEVDTRVFEAIEQALVHEVMSPVLFVHYSKGALSVVFDARLAKLWDQSLLSVWEYIAGRAIWEEWSFTALVPENLSNPLLPGRDLRQYGKTLLSREQLGVEAYSSKHYLYHKDWDHKAYRAAMGYDQEDDGLNEVHDFDDPLF